MSHKLKRDFSKPFVAVGCILEKDGKYLMVQEGCEPAVGLWNNTSGWLEKHEDIIECAKRETKEESGYDVEILGLLTVSSLNIVENLGEEAIDKHAVKLVFAARPIGEQGEYDKKEIMDIKWMTKEEVIGLGDKLRCYDIPEQIERFEKGQIYPLDVILETRQ